MSKIVTGIDVGTYHVKVVIAESGRPAPAAAYFRHRVRREPRHGQGYIVSVGEVSRSVAAAVSQASKAARVKVKKAYLGLGGIGLEEHLPAARRWLSAATPKSPNATSRAPSPQAKRLSRPRRSSTAGLIHTIPLRYYVDGARVLGRSPVGMKGMRARR